MNSLRSLGSARLLILVAALVAGSCVHPTSTIVNSCADLQGGTPMLVTHKNGALTSGNFVTLESMPFLDYLALYRRVTAGYPDCALLPVPGERISFGNILAPDHVWKGTLIGFCNRYVWVRVKGESDVTSFYLRGLSYITRLDGRTIFRYDLRRLMNANQLPIMTRMVVAAFADTEVIPLNDVARLEIQGEGMPRNVDIFATGRTE